MTALTNPQHEAFCRHYLVRPVGTVAARAAGYPDGSAHARAHDLLQRDDVQERIAELIHERDQAVEVEARDVLRELLRIALADPADAYDERGKLKAIHEIPTALRRTISSVKTEELFERHGKDREQIGYTKEIKFWDKGRGLEMLARHLALFRDVLKVDTSDPNKTEFDANLMAARVAAILESWRKRAEEAKDIL